MKIYTSTNKRLRSVSLKEFMKNPKLYYDKLEISAVQENNIECSHENSVAPELAEEEKKMDSVDEFPNRSISKEENVFEMEEIKNVHNDAHERRVKEYRQEGGFFGLIGENLNEDNNKQEQ